MSTSTGTPSAARTPVIVSAARTPIGRFLGGLSPLSAPELGAIAISAAVERAGIEPGAVQEVIMGNVVQGGVGQAPARQAAIKAGMPTDGLAVTVNKVCGSGLESRHARRAGDPGGRRRGARCGRAGIDVQRAVLSCTVRGTAYKLGDQTLVDGVVRDGLWCAFCNVHMGGHAEYTARKAGVTRAARINSLWSRTRRRWRRWTPGNSRPRSCPSRSPAERADAGRDGRRARGATRRSKSLAKLKPAFPKDAPKDMRPADLSVTAGNASLAE